MNDLDSRLLSAHLVQDAALLVTLYREAADQAHDRNAAGFYLTHAYVYALETGHADAAGLRETLIAQGRETPL